MSGIEVKLISYEGAEVLLGPAARHKLECKRSPCEFTNCACPPREQRVKVHSPEEPRMRKKEK